MKKILLIEDNLEVRENTAEILELAGHNVLTAEDGKEGVRLAKNELPDLVICDIMMPGLDGYGVLHILSRNASTSLIPFIFLTAKADKSDLRKGMNLGADDYITKPFEETELLDAIESRLKKNDFFKTSSSVDMIEGMVHRLTEIDGVKNLSTKERLKHYKKKDTIIHEGDSASVVYHVRKGRLKGFKINDEGKEYITNIYSIEDFFGYEAMIQDASNNETIVALEDCELYQIPKEDFAQLIFNNRDVSAAVIRLISGQVMSKEQQLLDLAYNTVRKRVADALYLLDEKYIDEEYIPASRTDLASIVGTATESVIRNLSEFKESKIIEVKGNKIKILDRKKLAAIKY